MFSWKLISDQLGLPPLSQLWKTVLYGWSAFSFCHWLSDAQLSCFQLLFSKIFSNHPSKGKQNVMSTDRWYLVTQNQSGLADARRQVSPSQNAMQVRGALTHPEPAQASCGQTLRLHSHVAANGHSQGLALLSAFSLSGTPECSEY